MVLNPFYRREISGVRGIGSLADATSRSSGPLVSRRHGRSHIILASDA
jgi:hypothetical protein